MQEQLDILLQIGGLLGRLLAPLLTFVATWLLLLIWIMWWLWAVDWRKVWPVLAEGAWVPVVLLMIAGALAWSQLAPQQGYFFPSVFSGDKLSKVIVGNFWWQLGDVGLLAVLALLCGRVQGWMAWHPAEINLEPAPVAHDHGHH